MSQHEKRADLRWSCCQANGKAACSWPPCPANLDCYTPDELREFAAYDAPRLDRAVAIFTGRGDA